MQETIMQSRMGAPQQQFGVRLISLKFSMIIKFLSFAVLTGNVNLQNNNSNRFIFTNTLAALNKHIISSPDNN